MLPLDHGNVVSALQIKPELCTMPELATESDSRIGGNRAATIEYIGDTARRHPKIEGEPLCTQIAGLQLTFQEATRCTAGRIA